MIPKRIISCWLNDRPMKPVKVLWCLQSQKIPGYEHHVITLENCSRDSEYVRLALANQRWVKASDYLRMDYLYRYGGIFLDADMEVLPGKNFDHLLDCRLFTSFECCGLYANSGLGCEPGHPFIKKYLDRVEDNYKGDGDLVFEPGIRTFHDVFWALQKDFNEFGVRMIPTEVCFPYNHSSNTVNVTPETLVYHHYMKSWLSEKNGG